MTTASTAPATAVPDPGQARRIAWAGDRPFHVPPTTPRARRRRALAKEAA